MENFCGKTAGIFELLGVILNFFKLAIPLIIIVLITFDFYKSVISHEDGTIKKSLKRAIFRLIPAILIFFLPSIVNLIFSLIGVEESDCLKCMLNTKTCAEIAIKNDGNGTNTGENSNGNNNGNDTCTVEDEDCINYSIFID